MSIILVMSGCVNNTEPIPDPIIGNWHLESSTNTFLLGDIAKGDWAPQDMTVKSDGTFVASNKLVGEWKWVSNNSYDFDSNNGYIPNATAKIENGKMVLIRSQWIPPCQVVGTYVK